MFLLGMVAGTIRSKKAKKPTTLEAFLREKLGTPLAEPEREKGEISVSSVKWLEIVKVENFVISTRRSVGDAEFWGIVMEYFKPHGLRVVAYFPGFVRLEGNHNSISWINVSNHTEDLRHTGAQYIQVTIGVRGDF